MSNKKNEFWTNYERAAKTLCAGGIAGAVSRTVVAPFERLKIIFQTQGNPPAYKGVLQSLDKIAREEGIKGYYKGNGTNCVRIFPTSALQFYSFETYKQFLIQNWAIPRGKKELTPIETLVAGGGAGITALIITYPLEFVRCRLTVQKEAHYKGILDCMTKVVRSDGVLALYKGLWPSIIGVVPYVGMDFATYETLKRYSPKQKDGTVSAVVTVTNGAIAGLVAQTVSYPLDLIRRRLQLQGFKTEISENTVAYKGMLDAFVVIWRNEGDRKSVV